MEDGRCHFTEHVPQTSGMLLRSMIRSSRSNLGYAAVVSMVDIAGFTVKLAYLAVLGYCDSKIV